MLTVDVREMLDPQTHDGVRVFFPPPCDPLQCQQPIGTGAGQWLEGTVCSNMRHTFSLSFLKFRFVFIFKTKQPWPAWNMLCRPRWS